MLYFVKIYTDYPRIFCYLSTDMSFQECGERFIDEDVSRSRRIIGGHEAAMNSWPWLVNFVDSSNKSFQVCAGNLIDPYWILTTAHCFISNRTKYAVDDWTYIAGDHHLRKADPYEQVIIIIYFVIFILTSQNEII